MFFKKKNFYQNLSEILSKLDQKYLIHEMDLLPNSWETQKLVEVLYEVDKSMKEQIKIIY
ncbi:MAG: sensor histidine kinase, partial [Bacilli bacterium]|nr:sensor histidine kinase [Bacilli bacterium]